MVQWCASILKHKPQGHYRERTTLRVLCGCERGHTVCLFIPECGVERYKISRPIAAQLSVQ